MIDSAGCNLIRDRGTNCIRRCRSFFFTTSSGVGYGLLAWIGLLAPIGALPLTRQFGAVSLLLALGCITAGLLSSTLHLGHPERAWRAISQWRSSWLSREGV